MDHQHFAEFAAGPPSGATAPAAGGPGSRILSNLHPILTNNLRSGSSHVPSSPVSPMLSAHDLPHSAPLSAAQQLSTKAFLNAIHHSTNHTGATTTTPNAATATLVAATTPKTGRDDESMAARTPSRTDPPRPLSRDQQAQHQQEEEMMSQEDEDGFEGLAAAGGLHHPQNQAAVPEYDPNLAPLSAEEMEQFQAEELAAHQWMLDGGGEFDDGLQPQEEHEGGAPATDADGNPIPAPATPSANLTREEKIALEEKTRLRKKAAEMRYLVNSMFRQ